jgi:hypothetical protein
MEYGIYKYKFIDKKLQEEIEKVAVQEANVEIISQEMSTEWRCAWAKEGDKGKYSSGVFFSHSIPEENRRDIEWSKYNEKLFEAKKFFRESRMKTEVGQQQYLNSLKGTSMEARRIAEKSEDEKKEVDNFYTSVRNRVGPVHESDKKVIEEKIKKALEERDEKESPEDKARREAMEKMSGSIPQEERTVKDWGPQKGPLIPEEELEQIFKDNQNLYGNFDEDLEDLKEILSEANAVNTNAGWSAALNRVLREAESGNSDNAQICITPIYRYISIYERVSDKNIQRIKDNFYV